MSSTDPKSFGAAVLAKAARASVTVHKPDVCDLNLVLGDTQEEVDARAREIGEAAIKKGHAVTWADGRKQWITVEPEVDLDEPNESDRYTWDRSGDRIRCTRKRVTVANGERTEENLSKVYLSWENAWSD